MCLTILGLRIKGLKPERFRKSKFTLSKVISDFTFDNVNFDLQKRLVFEYILQLLNICLILK